MAGRNIMKNRKRIIVIVGVTILLAIVAYMNKRAGFIYIPDDANMPDRQIDYITISTVFVGFAFTSLGLLLGLSGEKLIVKIKNTSIILDKVDRIITSIVFFILSFALSLYFVLGVNGAIFTDQGAYETATNILYIICVGYLICGVLYFVFSVYELYDLIKRIFGINNRKVKDQIQEANEKMKKNQEALKDADYDA